MSAGVSSHKAEKWGWGSFYLPSGFWVFYYIQEGLPRSEDMDFGLVGNDLGVARNLHTY
jgi:hypothetical protein